MGVRYKSYGMLGKKHSKESREKISIELKGRPHSIEHNKKVSLALKGIKKTDEEVRKNIETHNTKEYKEKVLKFWTPEKRKWRSKLSKKFRHSIETRKRQSLSKKGVNNPNWKGGIGSVNARIRASVEYKLWREAVFERDNYTCVWCLKSKSGQLNADHIKPFALYPELRFSIDNGRTLCIDCHKTTDTYAKNLKLAKSK